MLFMNVYVVKSIKMYTGMVNTKLRIVVPSGGNREGERDRNASGRGTQGAATNLIMCSFFKNKTKQNQKHL